MRPIEAPAKSFVSMARIGAINEATRDADFVSLKHEASSRAFVTGCPVRPSLRFARVNLPPHAL
jgi:hypothetical protein